MRHLRISLAATAALCLSALGAANALAVAPTISGTTFSHVTTSSVRLEAEINPQGIGTLYHFEYGTAECSINPNPCTKIPSPKEGQVPAGSSPIPVGVDVESLAPHTTYHFRVVAKNGQEAKGPERTFTTFLPPQTFPACPNEGFRTGNPAAARIEYSSANLPDCRAYEQATPVDKDGGDVTGTVPYVRAAANGAAIAYLSASGVPGGKGSQEIPSYLASRGEGAWSTHGLLPSAKSGQVAQVDGWTSDFSTIFDHAIRLGEPNTTTFLESPSTGGEEKTIVDYITELNPSFAASSADGSEVLFESKVAIPTVSGAVAGRSNVYIWDKASKTLRLASALNEEPPKAPPAGAFAGSYDWLLGTSPETLSKGGSARQYYTQEENAISKDGSAAYFTAGGSGQLYLRQNPAQEQSKLDSEGNCEEPAKACTINVSESHRTKPDPAGTRPAAFMGASADGTKSFFTSSQMLTNDANTGKEQEAAAIERSDLSGAGITPGFLPTHASGVAVDGSHVYWVDLEKGTIARAKLGATKAEEVEDEFITATDNPKGVAVDGSYIYWTNAAEEEGEGTIGRAKLGAGEAEEVDSDYVEGAGNPHGVAVDAEHVYWTNSPVKKEQSTKGFVGKAKLGALKGEEVEAELVEDFGVVRELSGIAVDAEHIYWMKTNTDDFSRISRANLNGSEYEITLIFLGQHAVGKGLAVQGNHIYWSAQATNLIGRAKLNGAGPATEEELEFIKDAKHPDGIAASATSLYWSSNGEAPPNPGNDLYRYDAKAKQLTDLTPDSADEDGIDVQGVLGISEDGSYVYFAANGVPAGVQNSPNGRGEEAEVGDCTKPPLNPTGFCNVYLWHEGQLAFIARLFAGGSADTDAWNWYSTPTGIFPGGRLQKTARLSADGRTLLFRSQRRLTEYDNEGTPQLYRYEVGSPESTCVSCNPSGLPPTEAGPEGGAGLGRSSPSVLIAKRPASTLTHNLSSDGKRVFFETTNGLVGADTNGEEGCPAVGSELQSFPACNDVYEWEAQGTGSCDAEHAVAEGGCLYLISTGKGKEPALLADASADGKDVFFFTRSRLVGQDEDSLLDIYDAREEGGLVGQNQPVPASCEGEGCKPGASPPPVVPSPPKFFGPPNPKPKAGCPKGKVRSKGRCVKKHQKAKSPHKKAKGKKRAQAKGRAGR